MSYSDSISKVTGYELSNRWSILGWGRTFPAETKSEADQPPICLQ